MADEEASTATIEADHHEDFAAAALRITKTDPDKPAPVVAKAPSEKKEASSYVATLEKQQSGVPDQLFKKADTKTEETHESEIDKIEAPDLRSDKNKAGWEALKGKAKELETKARELEKKLQGAEEGSKKAADLEAMIAEYDKKLVDISRKAEEYEGIVKKRWIEDDPEFRKTYIDGRSNLIGEARKIAEDSGIDPTAIEKALNLDGRPRVQALEEAAESMSSFQQGRLGEVITKLDRLDREALAKRGNPDDYRKEQEATRVAREREEAETFTRTSTKAFRDAVQEASKESLMLQRLDGVEWWNKNIDADLAKAEEIWKTNGDPKVAAKLVIRGIAAERAEQAYRDMRAERDTIQEKASKMEKELESLYGRGPKHSSNGTSVKAGEYRDFASQVAETAQLRGR